MLTAGSSRVEGSHPYNILPGREPLAAGEELCRQNLFDQGAALSMNNVELSVQKRLRMGVMLLKPCRTAFKEYKCREGNVQTR